MATGSRVSKRKKALKGKQKARRDREMAYIYLRTCKQVQATEGQWCRKAVYRCSQVFSRKRNTVRKCIQSVVENGKNRKLAEALAPWVPSAAPFVAGTAKDRRYLKMDQSEILDALVQYVNGE